jgi:hypothetical protein
VKQAIVGTYEMGYERVQLVLREGKGGEFYHLPGDIDCPRIKIGADHSEWWKILTALFHEAAEFAASRIGCRYSAADEIVGDMHTYLFVMTHPQFSEIHGMVADFVARCWEDLSKEWQNWKKEADK